MNQIYSIPIQPESEGDREAGCFSDVSEGAARPRPLFIKKEGMKSKGKQ
jgi:hypothetical protein